MSRMNDAERKAWEDEAVVWAKACTLSTREGYSPHGLAALILAAHREIVALRKVMEAAEGILPTAGARSPTQKLVLANLRAALNAAKGEG